MCREEEMICTCLKKISDYVVRAQAHEIPTKKAIKATNLGLDGDDWREL